MEAADQLSWSGDSRHILYDSAGTLRLISINGGAPKTVPVDLTWRPQAPPSGEKVIHAGRLWAGTSGSEQRNVDIVVSGNKIVSVGPAQPRSSYGAGVKYVDASQDTVIPGLWESHAHEGMDQPFAGGRTNRLELAMGITTEISMGDEPYHSLEEVESQQSGAAPGPRYFWAAEPIDGRQDLLRVDASGSEPVGGDDGSCAAREAEAGHPQDVREAPQQPRAGCDSGGSHPRDTVVLALLLAGAVVRPGWRLALGDTASGLPDRGIQRRRRLRRHDPAVRPLGNVDHHHAVHRARRTSFPRSTVSRSPVTRGSRRCRARGSTRWHSRSSRKPRSRRRSCQPKSGRLKR